MCLNLYPCAIKYYLISQPTHCQPTNRLWDADINQRSTAQKQLGMQQHAVETRTALSMSRTPMILVRRVCLWLDRHYKMEQLKGQRAWELKQPWISKITKTVKNREGLDCLNRSIGWVEVVLYVHRNRRFIRDGSPGRPPRFSHSSWALSIGFGSVVLHNVLGCRLTY